MGGKQGRKGRTSNSIGVDEANRDKVVLLIKVAPIADSEGLVRDRVVNGTPDVDDTNASLQQTFGIGAKVAVNARDGGVEGLINMNAFLRENCISHSYTRTACQISYSPQGHG